MGPCQSDFQPLYLNNAPINFDDSLQIYTTILPQYRYTILICDSKYQRNMTLLKLDWNAKITHFGPFNLLQQSHIQQPMKRSWWNFTTTYIKSCLMFIYKKNRKLLGRCRDIQCFLKRPLLSLPVYKASYKGNCYIVYLPIKWTDSESDWRWSINIANSNIYISYKWIESVVEKLTFVCEK